MDVKPGQVLLRQLPRVRNGTRPRAKNLGRPSCAGTSNTPSAVLLAEYVLRFTNGDRARWKWIISIGIALPNPPVPIVNNQLASLVLGDLGRDPNCLRLRIAPNCIAIVTLSANRPPAFSLEYMLIFSH